MTNQRNETPEPLDGATVEACTHALAEALRREKGWLFDYGHSVVRDAIDRKHLEPLTLPAHPEPHSHTWTEQEKRCILAWGAELVARKAGPLVQEQAGEMPAPAGYRTRFRSEPEMIGPYPWTYADSERRRRKYDRPEFDYEDLYTAEQMREYATAALQAKDAEIAEWRKLSDPAVLHANLLRGLPAQLTREQLLHLLGDDAEIARLKADAGPVTAVLAVDVGGRPGVHGQTIGADGAGQFAYIIRGTQEQADNWAREHIRQRERSGQRFFSSVLVFNEEGYGGPMLTEIDAAIRAQTGGEG